MERLTRTSGSNVRNEIIFVDGRLQKLEGGKMMVCINAHDIEYIW